MQLANNIDFSDNPAIQSFFSGIYLKDSTKLKLPDCFVNEFPGYGDKYGKTSDLSIQYEYEILSGKCQRLYFTKINRNDQADSRLTLDDIQANALYIRDLGYVTSSYLRGVVDRKAYYINHLPQMGVYLKKGNEFEKIQWKDIHAQMQKSNFRFKEMEVYLSSEKDIKTRMILFPLSSKTVEKRIRRASQKVKSKKYSRYNVSEDYKIKKHYGIFITNVPENVLTADQIYNAYRLRWQIELIFKAWKSHLKFDKLKVMNINRFQCHLLANFIWFLMSWKIFQLTNYLAKITNQKYGTSVLKFYQIINRKKQIIQRLLKTKTGLEKWLNQQIIEIMLDTLLEKRKNKMTHNELIISLNLT